MSSTLEMLKKRPKPSSFPALPDSSLYLFTGDLWACKHYKEKYIHVSIKCDKGTFACLHVCAGQVKLEVGQVNPDCHLPKWTGKMSPQRTILLVLNTGKFDVRAGKIWEVPTQRAGNLKPLMLSPDSSYNLGALTCTLYFARFNFH